MIHYAQYCSNCLIMGYYLVAEALVGFAAEEHKGNDRGPWHQ